MNDTPLIAQVEGNHWHDTYWGVCNPEAFGKPPCTKGCGGTGENQLGKILMRVRDELRCAEAEAAAAAAAAAAPAPTVNYTDVSQSYPADGRSPQGGRSSARPWCPCLKNMSMM